MTEMEEYKNKETEKLEKFLNEARDKLNKECCCEVMPYKADVRFLRPKKRVE